VHYSAIFCHSLDGLLEEEGGEDSGSMCNISAGTTHCGNAVTELGDNTCTFLCKCDCNEWVSSISKQIVHIQILNIGFMWYNSIFLGFMLLSISGLAHKPVVATCC